MIGGEFEIDLSIQQDFVPQPDTYYYASGRTALYQILHSMVPLRKKVAGSPSYPVLSRKEVMGL